MVDDRAFKLGVNIAATPGKVVYQNDELPGSTVASFEVLGDPAARTVTIGLPSRSITLTFTDEAPDPQAAADGAVRASFDRLVSQAQRAADALQAAVRERAEPADPFREDVEP